jgi:hypothetical protein
MALARDIRRHVRATTCRGENPVMKNRCRMRGSRCRGAWLVAGAGVGVGARPRWPAGRHPSPGAGRPSRPVSRRGNLRPISLSPTPRASSRPRTASVRRAAHSGRLPTPSLSVTRRRCGGVERACRPGQPLAVKVPRSRARRLREQRDREHHEAHPRGDRPQRPLQNSRGVPAQPAAPRLPAPPP